MVKMGIDFPKMGTTRAINGNDARVTALSLPRLRFCDAVELGPTSRGNELEDEYRWVKS